MSVVQRIPQSGVQKSEALRSRLAQEWQDNKNGTLEPIIIQEKAQYYNDLLHFYVIWSEWAEMPQRDRSNVILEAYKASHPNEAGMRVSIAMGLTPEEAKRMGIQYASLEPAA